MQLWNNGMIGDYTTAMRNRGNFTTFFQLSGRLALQSDYKSGCNGLDAAAADAAAGRLRGR